MLKVVQGICNNDLHLVNDDILHTDLVGPVEQLLFPPVCHCKLVRYERLLSVTKIDYKRLSMNIPADFI